MAILSGCCCWKSVRKGSFASGFYTLIYYSILVVGGTFEVDSIIMSHNNDTMTSNNSESHASAAPLSFTISVLVCAGISVLASVVLLVGLCVDNRLMLLPWISCITTTTIICFIYSIYMIVTMTFQPILGFIFTLDFLLSLLNVYCLLCVISQYQEYKAGRGFSEDDSRFYQPPIKHDSWVSTFYNSKRPEAIQKEKNLYSSAGGLTKSKERNREAKTLLVPDEDPSAADGNKRRSKPRIHFQEPDDDTSCTLSSSRCGGVVLKDSPSTDTTSSKLPSDNSPNPKNKHVQFSGTEDEESSLDEHYVISKMEPTSQNELLPPPY